jgi:inhibitor of KinA
VKTDFRIVALGDSALAIEFEERIDPTVNARAIWLAATVRAGGIPGVRDVVPTFRSVAVYFDPLRTRTDRLVEWLDKAAADSAAAPSAERTPIEVPVCYGSEFGPDLDEVAGFSGMPVEEVVRVHCGGRYRVFMLGFVPGFAYLGSLDPRIAAPRRPTPRVRVPTGSVGIAGRQTGVYPAETPGGWQLIGRTPVKPFDLSRSVPCLFSAGDVVQFVPIARSEFDRLLHAGHE